MTIVSVKTNALDYTNDVLIVPDHYENGALYLALYTIDNELYTDISTYIMPVLPCQFFVETGSESERFCKEQVGLFFDMDCKVKQGFNTYSLYYYNGFIH